MSSDLSADSHEKQWYDANCHCRAIQLRFKCLPLESINIQGSTNSKKSDSQGEKEATALKTANCNCSICAKNGYLLVYPDINTEVEWVQGKDRLSKYNFGSQMATHLFCPTCGSSMGIEADFAKVGMPERGRKACINVSDSPQLTPYCISCQVRHCFTWYPQQHAAVTMRHISIPKSAFDWAWACQSRLEERLFLILDTCAKTRRCLGQNVERN